MKARIALSLFAILLVSLFAVAQERTQLPADTVFVSGEGKFEADPDLAVVNFEISVQEKKAKDAYERASRSAEQVRSLLRSNGVDPSAAEVGHYSLFPIYEWNKPPKRKVVAYRVSTNVSLKLKDFAKIGPIMEGLSEMDITGGQSVNYILDNIDAAKAKAVEDAMRRARNSAEAAAKVGGRSLGTLSSATVDVFEPVVPLLRQERSGDVAIAMSARAAPAAPPTAEFAPQKITITAQVKALFRLQ
jgi:hypothetical protein